MKKLALLVAVAAVACSNPAPAPEKKVEPAKAENPLEPMHAVLAPLWHMAEGPERIVKTCEGVDGLAARAAELVAAPTPAKAQAKDAEWKDGAKAMAAQVEALRAACAVEGRADVAVRLKELHGGYHGLIVIIKSE